MTALRDDPGDSTRPRWFCPECGLVIYVDPNRGEFPPDSARRLFLKTHDRRCHGVESYCAGVIFVPKLNERG